MNPSIRKRAEELGLQPHPEGGFFLETYRSGDSLPAGVLPNGINGDRNVSTCIYFLLSSEFFSAFHRIRQDELWFFHEGSSALVHVIDEKGDYRQLRVGPPEKGGNYQAIIPAASWFAAEVTEPDSYCLVSCTVAPGFDFADFELAEREALRSEFPGHHDLITRLTRV